VKKTIPTFKTDEEAENFVDTADLSEYDLKGQFVKFELKRKDTTVSLRMPESLLTQVREQAAKVGIPTQRFMRLAIERALASPQPK